jgi:hypothetical protein
LQLKVSVEEESRNGLRSRTRDEIEAECSLSGSTLALQHPDLALTIRRMRTSAQLPSRNRQTNCIMLLGAGAWIDTGSGGPNNARMAKPETVRRVKSYSAESGYVYQYQFHDAVPAERNGESGNEYLYYVSADRKTMFPLKIFVGRNTREDCARRLGRTLNGTEEYAVAKMRLFQAFDESEDLATKRPELVVDASNIEALLARLDL